MKKFLFAAVIAILLQSTSFALFDTGTAMKKGKLEVDVSVNPFEIFTNGQNWVFVHYGLGDDWEVHGYFSKWGTIQDWSGSTYEIYAGLLKQWANFQYLDLSTSVGLRKVLKESDTPSIFGPSLLYTVKLNERSRIAGHLMPIWDLPCLALPVRQAGGRQATGGGMKLLNRGYSYEIGVYHMLTSNLEFAYGIFVNTMGTANPIYTFNYYF